jgi:hypothetical protein
MYYVLKTIGDGSRVTGGRQGFMIKEVYQQFPAIQNLHPVRTKFRLMGGNDK